jgi:curved DNA-binding protein CbpA
MPPRRDPYAVLGVPRTASPADIRAAYRRLALAHHPDKAGGGGDRDAFAEAAAAHAVLADPASRAAYDARSAGGAASDAAADALDDLAGVTVDVSSLGVVDAALLSVFSKLGVRVAHAPPPSVLEAARLGLFEAAPLAWGSACVAGSVDRGAAQWFRVDAPPPGGAAAFAGYSRAGSRIQLLLFEPAAQSGGGGSGWELVAAADSTPTGGGGQLAALFCGAPYGTWHLQPSKTPAALAAAAADGPAARVLRRLDGLAPREPLPPVGGPSLLAIVGGNLWRRASFTVRAVALEGGGGGAPRAPPPAQASPSRPPPVVRDPAAALRAAEDALVAKRRALGDIEASYRAAEAALRRAADDVAAAGGEVDALLAARDAAYLDLLGLLPGGGD